MEPNYYVDYYYNWFNSNVENTPLGEYFHLPHTKLDLVRNSAYEFELTLVHKKKEIPPKIDCLPLDLLRYISSFITYKHRIVVGFMCLNDYPLVPPTWHLREAGPFIFMQNAVFRHNYDYSIPGNWFMQCMESDILQMVVRILAVMD